MRSHCLLSNISLVVIIAFVTTMSLAGCGGSSGGGGSGSEESDSTFTAVQTTATASDGTASITGSVSGKTINFDIENTSGVDLSGLDIEYVETGDGTSGMAIISDPSGVYQTISVVLESDDLSSESLNVQANTTSGEHVDFFVISTSLVITIVIAALTAKAAYDLATGVYELYCDPPTLSSYGEADYLCISVDQIMTSIGIVSDAYGLLTMGTMNAAKTALTEGTKTAFEIVGEEIVDEATGELQDEMLDQFLNMVTGDKGYDSSTEYCVMLWNDLTGKSERYMSAMDVTGQTCSSASDCSGAASAAATAVESEERDRDVDGYSVADGDCNDLNRSIYPGAVEICGNGIIEDCDLSAEPECNTNIDINISSPPYGESCPAEMLMTGVCSDNSTRGLFTTAEITADPMPEYAYVVVNGRANRADIQDNGDGTGSLISGNMGILKCNANNWINQFVVLVDDGTNYAAEEIAFGCYAAATKLLILLQWDQCDTDLDLYVKEMAGTASEQTLWDESGTTSLNGGTITDTFGDCLGPVYYENTAAGAGTYQIRVHYREGATTPNYQLYIVTDEDFDHAEVITGSLTTSNSAVSGTANFSSTDSSWMTYTFELIKNSYGGWQIGLASE